MKNSPAVYSMRIRCGGIPFLVGLDLHFALNKNLTVESMSEKSENQQSKPGWNAEHYPVSVGIFALLLSNLTCKVHLPSGQPEKMF